MAHVSVSSPVASGPRTWIGDFLEGILAGLARIAEASPKVRQMNALMALSDEDLARRGLRREDIARHVFADSLYL